MFNESTLEKAIINNLIEQNYEYIKGEDIHKEMSDVLLRDDFRNFLMTRYDLTNYEIQVLLQKFDNYSNADLYSSNKEIMTLISEGTTIRREDKTPKSFL